jgi:hypothetical protein
MTFGFPDTAPLINFLLDDKINLQALKTITSYNSLLRHPYPDVAGTIPFRFTSSSLSSSNSLNVSEVKVKKFEKGLMRFPLRKKKFIQPKLVFKRPPDASSSGQESNRYYDILL